MFDKQKNFLLGGDYNPDQWQNYPEILKQDIAYMKQANVNTVTLGVFAWDSLEPEEGHYQFEWLDHAFDAIESIGGNVILATPSGGRPQWLSAKYPEVNRVDEFGRRHHHGFRHNHCFSSPIYREKIQALNTQLAKRYGNRKSLILWHVSNELGGECFCDLCQQRWQTWVKARYQTLAVLNQAWCMNFWGNTYTDWRQVVPPSPLGESKNHGMDLDWKRFLTDQTIDYYEAECQPLRALTPNMPITTNFMAEGYDTHDFIPLQGIDYGRFAKHVDIVSWDSYPDWHNQYESLATTAMKSAYVHDQYWSLKQQPFMVMESTPSYVNSHPYNKSKRPGMNLLSSMQQIAHGSESSLYFQWRQARGNSEKFHGAIVEHDGQTSNRVFKEVAEYGQELKALAEIKGTGKKVKVAIIFDWESNWAINRGGGFGRPSRQYLQTLQKHYAVFWERDIAVDIITPQQDYAQYDLLIAPMLYMLDAQDEMKLQAYVANGGTLISSYFTGMVDKNDLVNQGGLPEKLQSLFGIETTELEMLYPTESNRIQYQQQDYCTKDYSNLLVAKEADILATYQTDFYAGSPAITVNKYQKGQAYYLGTRLNHDFLTNFYDDIIQRLGLNNTVVEQSDAEVSIQTRENNRYKYHFVMNFSNKNKLVNFNRPQLDMLDYNQLVEKIELQPLQVKVYKELIE